MARTFASASSQNAFTNTLPVSNVPFSFSCWINATTLPGTAMYVMELTFAAGNAFYTMGIGSGNAPFVIHYDGTNSGQANHATTISTSTWYNIVGVFASTTSRSIYLNGLNGVTNTTNCPNVIAASSQVIASTFRGSAFANYFNGQIAEIAIWDAALTSDDALMLATGATPAIVKADNLVTYWPLIGNNSPEPNYWNVANSLTLNNTPSTSAHPRVYYNSPAHIAYSTPIAYSLELGMGTYNLSGSSITMTGPARAIQQVTGSYEHARSLTGTIES